MNYCKFCQMNIRGTPCQTESVANKCANTRGREPDYDDYLSFMLFSQEFKNEIASTIESGQEE